jgi:hypothetical protein
MGSQWNNDLHRRQETDDVGLFRISGSRLSGRRRWMPFRTPLGLLVVGILLTQYGPVPGLGALLVLGAIGGLLVVALLAFMGTS